MKLSDKITRAFLYNIANGNEIVIPNFYMWWEMDIFRMLPSGYIYEYEIKISRADFKNDFNKWDKHKMLQGGKLSCNRFYFIVPKDLVAISEIPDYCGLIYFEELPKNRWKFTTVQNAKFLHKDKKVDDIKFMHRLMTKIAYREYIVGCKLRDLRRDIDSLKSTIIENNLELPYLY